jgi:hypothetical protein
MYAPVANVGLLPAAESGPPHAAYDGDRSASAEPVVHLVIEDEQEVSASELLRTPTSLGQTPSVDQRGGEDAAPTSRARSRRARRGETRPVDPTVSLQFAGTAAPTLTKEELAVRIAARDTDAALRRHDQANDEGVPASLAGCGTTVRVLRDRFVGSEGPSAEASLVDDHADHAPTVGKQLDEKLGQPLAPAPLDAPTASTAVHVEPRLLGPAASTDSATISAEEVLVPIVSPLPPPVVAADDGTSDNKRREQRRERRRKRKAQQADAGSWAHPPLPNCDSEDRPRFGRLHMHMTSVYPLPLPTEQEESYLSGRDRRVPGFLPPL